MLQPSWSVTKKSYEALLWRNLDLYFAFEFFSYKKTQDMDKDTRWARGVVVNFPHLPTRSTRTRLVGLPVPGIILVDSSVDDIHGRPRLNPRVSIVGESVGTIPLALSSPPSKKKITPESSCKRSPRPLP